VGAIHRDEEECDNPDNFVPKRWLNNKSGTKNPVQDNKDQRRVHYGGVPGGVHTPVRDLLKALWLVFTGYAENFDLSANNAM
jgi:hypothetical protein